MRHRGIYSGKDYDVAGRMFLAAGTVTNYNRRPSVYSSWRESGDPQGQPAGSWVIPLPLLVALVLPDLDSAGNPVVVRRNGPFSEAEQVFTSPADCPNSFPCSWSA